MAIGLRSTSSVAYGTRTNTTVNAPAGATTGDVIVIAFQFGGSSAPSPTAPSGWTQMAAVTFSKSDPWYVVGQVWVRSHDGNSSWTWTHSSADTQAHAFAFTGVDTSTILDCTAQTATSPGDPSASPITVPSITTATDGAYGILSRASWDGLAITAPTGWTESYDSPVLWVGYREWATAGATGTFTMSTGNYADNPAGVIHGALRPASSSTPLTVDSLNHAVSLDGPLSLTVTHVLAVAPLGLVVSLEGPLSLEAAIGLAVASVDVAVSLDGPLSLTVTHVLAVADMLLPVTMSQEGLPLTQTHVLAVAGLDHAVALDGPLTVTPAGQLDMAPLDLAVTIDQVALTQAHALTVAALDHTVTLDGPLTVTEHTAGSLVVQPLDHAVALDGPLTLTQAHSLMVAPLDHTVALDGPLTITVQAIGLVVGDVSWVVQLDQVALSVTHILVVQSLLLAVLLDSAESVSWSLWVGGVEVSCTLQGVYDGSVVQPVATVEVVS